MSGYAGKILRVDLTSQQVGEEKLEEEILRKYIGGAPLGVKYIYDEIPAGVEWSSPENRLIFAIGPMGGTKIQGSSNFSVVTKGPMTNGATSTQANGFFGAYLKLAGFDAIIVQGIAERPCYLHIHDGVVELKDAAQLWGQDIFETEELLRKGLGKTGRQVSVVAIGPAGENLVRFAGIIGDGGHSASHNGTGAVMGSKKLKAIVIERSKGVVPVKEPERLSQLIKDMFAAVKKDPWHRELYEWGTSAIYSRYEARGLLPVKNTSTSVFPEHESFMGRNLRPRFELKPDPCWACRMHHCHTMKVTEGPYKGYVGEEPEYSAWAHWGANIGNYDLGAVVMLSDVTDRLGLEIGEVGWIVSWLMECYEREIIGSKETDGLKMTWGNVEAVRTMLHKIARRQGVGELYANGLKHAVETLGGEAKEYAIYTERGNAPGAHDERALWSGILDVTVSNTSTREAGTLWVRHHELGLPPIIDPFSPEQVANHVAKVKGVMQFYDSLGICLFCNAAELKIAVAMLNAVTGWDFTAEEAMAVGKRTVNLMRVFNLRHGLTRAQERPSSYFASAPVDGPVKGVSIMPHWDQMVNIYYQEMGWDEETGKPLPDTLKKLDLEPAVAEMWE